MAILAATALFVAVGACGRQVELDPRDAEALAEYEEETGCDRTTVTVQLKINNRGSAGYDVYLYSRSGGRRRLGSIGGFAKRLKLVSRYELEIGGTFVVTQSSGLIIGSGTYRVPVNLLNCDVGYLELGPSLELSHYIGMDFHPNERYRR